MPEPGAAALMPAAAGIADLAQCEYRERARTIVDPDQCGRLAPTLDIQSQNCRMALVGDSVVNLYTLPALIAASASDALVSLNPFSRHVPGDENEAARQRRTGWCTPHELPLELRTMDLRDFSISREGIATLLCAPFALHRATVADFAPGHSIVESLRNSGLGRVHVTDWHSAEPDMRFLSIDNYLADLNVTVDELKPPVDLVGLCQGGWLSLVYAARFPHKVRRLVLAGAPVDITAGISPISQGCASAARRVGASYRRVWRACARQIRAASVGIGIKHQERTGNPAALG